MNSGKLHSKTYSIGGKSVLKVSSDTRNIFGFLELRPDIDSFSNCQDSDYNIIILSRVVESFKILEKNNCTEIFSYSNVKIYSSDGNKFGDWYGKAQSLTNSRNDISIIIYPGYRDYLPAFFYRMIFRPILDTMLINNGYLLIHAAAVSANDSGWIIAGETGTGKSTTVKALVSEGLFFFGDDRTVLHTDRPFHILSYPEYICSLRQGYPDKIKSNIFRTKDDSIIKAVIIIDKNNTKSSFKIEQIHPAQATARLILHSCISIDENMMDNRRINHISDICQKADCYLLSGYGSVEEKVGLIKKLIAESK